ncbi:hypothetical protein JI742_13445 [Piscinibacter sp. Jin2]|uniref:Uncharacterized protein n=1 Tax=Aquariibacter lacus TaxID=2801332 RepID=A0A9X0XGY4_9BURK|nr:hypothetical protein [Piscinibacter lacus]MBL0720893.1 hypothetical protein [Piscinibacter lacus]
MNRSARARRAALARAEARLAASRAALIRRLAPAEAAAPAGGAWSGGLAAWLAHALDPAAPPLATAPPLHALLPLLQGLIAPALGRHPLAGLLGAAVLGAVLVRLRAWRALRGRVAWRTLGLSLLLRALRQQAAAQAPRPAAAQPPPTPTPTPTPPPSQPARPAQPETPVQAAPAVQPAQTAAP